MMQASVHAPIHDAYVGSAERRENACTLGAPWAAARMGVVAAPAE
jgi:hypothetical protein